MSNRFFAILLAIIAIFFGIFFFSKNKTDAPGNGGNTTVQPTNHVKGEGKKNVTLIEYGDFQCPACAAYFPIVEQLREKYKADIIFQFRHFPLVQIHQNAFAAHRAAEAAGRQDKFFEMYVLLYQNQKAWETVSDPTNMFVSYAGQIQLNTEQFKTDMASSEVNDIINADIREGQKVGATSTPTFVLDGKKLDPNPRNLEEFEKLIQDAIKAKTGQ